MGHLNGKFEPINWRPSNEIINQPKLASHIWISKSTKIVKNHQIEQKFKMKSVAKIHQNDQNRLNRRKTTEMSVDSQLFLKGMTHRVASIETSSRVVSRNWWLTMTPFSPLKNHQKNLKKKWKWKNAVIECIVPDWMKNYQTLRVGKINGRWSSSMSYIIDVDRRGVSLSPFLSVASWRQIHRKKSFFLSINSSRLISIWSSRVAI